MKIAFDIVSVKRKSKVVLQLVCLGLAMFFLFLANQNADRHEQFSAMLSKKYEYKIPIGQPSTNRSLPAHFVYEGRYFAEKSDHIAKVSITLHEKGRFVSKGIVGRYYFENLGRWFESDGNLMLYPITGSGLLMPVYGDFTVNGEGSYSQGNIVLTESAAPLSLSAEDYNYQIWLDPRFIVALLLLASSVALRKFLPV